MSTFLIVDDDLASCRTLQLHFRTQGHEAHVAHSATEALAARSRVAPELIILDVRMPGRSGLDALPEIKRTFPAAHAIVVTAFHDMETTIQAMQRGADDYIQKPIDLEELNAAVAKALRYAGGEAHGVLVSSAEHAGGDHDCMAGHSRAMKEVFKRIGLAAASNATVLITGESGTGKELVARAIHGLSPRARGPLVAINCGAISPELIESELFGHEKGAFTGAQFRHKGKFELADGGTLFLDEVGTVTPRVQVELLRVLEEKKVTRLGGTASIKTDFRVVAATNQDLELAVRDGRFRDDLYWRLNVFVIDLPPLRERPEDIPELAEHFLGRFTLAMNRPQMRFSKEALETLRAYTWPGNVRELQNAVERAVVLGSPPEIQVGDLPLRVGSQPETNGAGPLSLEEVERAHVRRVLDRCDWNVSQAAKILGIDRGTLYAKIRRYSLERAPV